MTNSRNKGASFEREVAKMLHLELGLKFERDLDQYRKSDRGDLLCTADNWPFLIECKRAASGTGCRPAWWAQAENAANAQRLRPVVIWKYDRRDIRVTMDMTDVAECIATFEGRCENHLIDMSLKGFCYVAREALAT